MHARRYVLILLVALTAGLLLALSWPRLNASIRYLPVDTAMSNYWESGEFDNTQLKALIERTEETIAIHDHYRYWDGLSELQILSSQDISLSFWERREALQICIEAASEVLKRAPSKPRIWLRLARAKDFLAYPAEELIPDLRMSILTGRVEPTLMLARLELGLRHHSVLQPDMLRLLRDQAVLTWTNQQRPMLEKIKSGELNLNLLRQVLSENNQVIIAEMEAHFVQ